MEFLNKAYSQLADLFRTMTPGARITAGLLGAVIVVSLVFLFRSQINKADEYLFGGRDFSQNELATMEAAFAKAGLGDSEIVGNRMRVPHAKKADYVAALAEANALPAKFYDFMILALANDGPFTSEKARKERMKNAKQQELSHFISHIKDIDYGSVQYDESDKPGFARRKEKTATVIVKAIGNNRLSAEQVSAIRNLVAAAYAGMKRSMVTITDMNGGSYPGSDGEGPAGALENQFTETKAKLEKFYYEKIYKNLARMIPGVLVAVEVDLNRELVDEVSSLKYDPQSTILKSKERDRELITKNSNTGGRPGAAGNGVITNSPATIIGSGGVESTTTENNTESSGVASQIRSIKKYAKLTPKQVKAAVSIPQSYFLKVWQEKNLTPSGETEKTPDPAELKALEVATIKIIEDHVRGLVPSPEDRDDVIPQVVVSVFQDFTPQQITKPGAVDHALSWLGANWQTLGMAFVGLFGLMMLRGMVRSSLSGEAALQENAAVQLAETEIEEEEGEEVSEQIDSILGLKQRQPTNAPNLRNELTEMVHGDIDAAANVLRNWIGDAA